MEPSNLSVIRMKRDRDGASLGDFVVCGDLGINSSLMSKMQAVGLGQEPVRRVFRHVASCSEAEAQTLLSHPELLEKKRLEVKMQGRAWKSDRDREGQRARLKASRLRVLEEKRIEGGGARTVIDVDLGGKRRREGEDEEDDDANTMDPIMCNGTPLKRTNVSLAEVMVDLFVEEPENSKNHQSPFDDDDHVQEIYLDRFYEDDEEEFRNMNLGGDDEDPDGQEVDYPDSSSSGGSSDRDEFGGWARSRDEEDEEELDVYGEGYMENDRMRHFDCSPYDQEDEME